MKRQAKQDWGFPRWGGYGRGREAISVRACDREGCPDEGKHPAPKAPNSKDRWYFCEIHAAEYNKGWNFFAGMSPEEAARFAEDEARYGAGYRQTNTYAHAADGSADGLTRAERDALAVLGLETDAQGPLIKTTYRKLAKRFHPDANPNDPAASTRFHQVQKAYETLKHKV